MCTPPPPKKKIIFDHIQTNSLKTNQAEFFVFDKFTLQNLANKCWGEKNNLLNFFYITSEVKQCCEALYLSYRPQTECSISQFLQTNCTQPIFRTINRGLLAKPFKKFQNHLQGQPVPTFDKRQSYSAN